ncbi:MAG TPA: LysR family transcriptional regulator, partial [Sphingomonas sp.]|nr:LysR family transcriptional regulator [Sphingomonas sp.]
MKRLPSIATLRLFIQVAKSASFSETARVAAISQPALSRTIRLLEEELGVRLFDRDTRNVRLTSAGETLLPAVQRLVREFEDTFGELEQSFSGKRGHVVIGALPSVAAKMLPLALVDFCTANPDIELTVREGLSDDLYQQMRDRQIDLAIVTPPDRADQFDFVAMLEDECVLVPGQSPGKRRKGLYPGYRGGLPHVPPHSVAAAVDAEFRRAGELHLSRSWFGAVGERGCDPAGYSAADQRIEPSGERSDLLREQSALAAGVVQLPFELPDLW